MHPSLKYLSVAAMVPNIRRDQGLYVYVFKNYQYSIQSLNDSIGLLFGFSAISDDSQTFFQVLFLFSYFCFPYILSLIGCSTKIHFFILHLLHILFVYLIYYRFLYFFFLSCLVLFAVNI